MPVINVGDRLWWRGSQGGPWLVERVYDGTKVRIWRPDHGVQYAHQEELYTPVTERLRRACAAHRSRQ